MEYYDAHKHLAGGVYPLTFLFRSPDDAAIMNVSAESTSSCAQQTRVNQLSTSGSTSGQLEFGHCVVCMERSRECAYVPCGHLVLCRVCMSTIRARTRQPIECVICKCKCFSIIKVFL